MKFCTWHDSCAVMICAKFCSDMVFCNGFTLKPVFCRSWITMVKLFVKRTRVVFICRLFVDKSKLQSAIESHLQEDGCRVTVLPYGTMKEHLDDLVKKATGKTWVGCWALYYYWTWRRRKTFSQWERGFHWKQFCHWLKGLQQHQIDVVILGPDLAWANLIWYLLFHSFFLFFSLTSVSCNVTSNYPMQLGKHSTSMLRWMGRFVFWTVKFIFLPFQVSEKSSHAIFSAVPQVIIHVHWYLNKMVNILQIL